MLTLGDCQKELKRLRLVRPKLKREWAGDDVHKAADTVLVMLEDVQQQVMAGAVNARIDREKYNYRNAQWLIQLSINDIESWVLTGYSWQSPVSRFCEDSFKMSEGELLWYEFMTGVSNCCASVWAKIKPLVFVEKSNGQEGTDTKVDVK